MIVTIGGSGESTEKTWQLSGIPPEGLRVPNRNGSGLAEVSFRFPDDAAASDSAGQWWVGHLAVDVRLRQARRGSVVIFMSTADRGAVQAKVVATEGSDKIETRSVSWVEGSRTVVSSGRTQRISATNYLQVAGVVPGRQSVSFSYDVIGDPDLLEELVVLPSTSISRTSASPFQVRIIAVDAVETDAQGRAEIPYEVFLRGDRAAGRVIVVASSEREGIKLAEPAQVVVPEHRGKPVSVKRRVAIEAAEPGVYRLMLRVQSRLNPATAVVTVRRV